MGDAYVVDYLRTAFSRSRPKEPERDVFNSLRMDEALAMLIKQMVQRTNIDPLEIGDVVTGCAFQAGENWLYGGRHPVLLAGLPVEVPGVGIERACSSSMMSITTGAMEIMTGNSEIVLAGGMEHMTHLPIGDNPFIIPNYKLLTMPEYAKYRMGISYNMGLTAEQLSEESGIKKEDMDKFALRSHKLASKAQEAGWFNKEIMPVEVESNGQKLVVDKDQSVRPDTTLDQISKLPPAFKSNGVITVGNSSPLNAGASLVMLASENAVKKYGLKPLAKIRSFGWAGVDPAVMGKGPVPATRKALKMAGINVEDVDYWEINEAFSVVVLYAIRELKLDIDRVNIHGGAISIGHPLGATGARLVGTLARTLNDENKKIGVATLCVGGGQGFSIVLEKV